MSSRRLSFSCFDLRFDFEYIKIIKNLGLLYHIFTVFQDNLKYFSEKLDLIKYGVILTYQKE